MNGGRGDRKTTLVRLDTGLSNDVQCVGIVNGIHNILPSGGKTSRIAQWPPYCSSGISNFENRGMPVLDANLASEILAEAEALNERRAQLEAQLRAIDERCRQLIEIAASNEIKESHARHLATDEACRCEAATQADAPASDNDSKAEVPQLSLFPRKA